MSGAVVVYYGSHSFIALQLFSAYKSSHLTVSYNIFLYLDAKMALYRYAQIVNHHTPNIMQMLSVR